MKNLTKVRVRGPSTSSTFIMCRIAYVHIIEFIPMQRKLFLKLFIESPCMYSMDRTKIDTFFIIQ